MPQLERKREERERDDGGGLDLVFLKRRGVLWGKRSLGGNNGDRNKVKQQEHSVIKDMVLKVSGSSRQCKGGGGSSSFRSKSFHPHHYFDDGEMIAVARSHHRRPLRPASAKAWDVSYEEARSSARWTGSGGADAVAAALGNVVLEDEGRPKEWVAQVEPGVHITFVSLPGGAGNDLRRIRFSREMFNKWQAQRWWGENYDRIMELYNVQRFNRQALSPPPRSDDGSERESFYSRVGSIRESSAGKDYRSAIRHTNRPPLTSTAGKGVCYPFVPDPSEQFFPHHLHYGAGVSGVRAETSSVDASRTTTSSRDEASISISNASDMEITEWVEEDEPGVFITIRELADGTRDLRRVRFSRERFAEVNAKLWWEENRERIQAQYL
ncbi:protein Brevis radix-like 4 isoform X2 [Zingiber officinale]|uniref:protein Brevis radix-like 4 isoform X2 n=1 Tax=Zingiber officinale TaxID=94328 RepID=UPI001C4CFF7D|nr:protein Brevis radix-like 4 isoform X2 [Zingiber officinale]